MSIKRMSQIVLISGAVLTGGSTALALTGISPAELNAMPINIQLSSPSSSSPVSRSLVLSGTARPDTGLTVAIDGLSYVDSRDRGVTEGRDGSIPAVSDANGRFSITLDLSGSDVVVNGAGQFQGISSGNHEFIVHEMYAQDSGRSQAITLNVDGQGAAAAVTPTPTPSTSPSPSASPLPEKEASSEMIPVLISAALGALFGYGAFRLFSRK